MKKFKFPIPAEATLVFEFAEENNIKEPAARYHLEKMVKAGVLKKDYTLIETERDYYNPMYTHAWIRHAKYMPA